MCIRDRPTLDAALAGEESPFLLNLSGEWRFLFCPSVGSCPNGFERVDFSDENFDRIPVPSNWQLEGYDTPIYTNIRYPDPISTKRGAVSYTHLDVYKRQVVLRSMILVQTPP